MNDSSQNSSLNFNDADSTQNSTSSLPEIAEYEARSSRLKNLLLSGNKKSKKKDKKKINPDKLEHVKFQHEVDAGYYTPTEEEVSRLVLVPHFENVHFHDFRRYAKLQLNDDQSDDSDIKVPAGLTLEQYKEIRKRSSEKAKKLYEKCFPPGSSQMDRHRLYVDESSPNLLSPSTQKNENMYGETQDVLINAILKLNHEVKQIQKRNEILEGNLQLLDKAKQMLEVTAKCSIEAIQWEKQKIQEYYDEKRQKEKAENREGDKELVHSDQHKYPKSSPKLKSKPK